MQLSVRLLCVLLGSTTLCLVLLVKLFQYNLQGRVALWIRFTLNLEFKFPVLANCVTLLLGCCRSSGVATSTLTMLVAVDLLRLGKLFPFAVGTSVGTMVSGILSAVTSSNIEDGKAVALPHLFFNLSVALVWFPLPFMRAFPTSRSKFFWQSGS